jgi:hypothetical protein
MSERRNSLILPSCLHAHLWLSTLLRFAGRFGKFVWTLGLRFGDGCAKPLAVRKIRGILFHVLSPIRAGQPELQLTRS